MAKYYFEEYKLGESADEVLNIETRQENADAALELVRQCRLKLSIISRELDPFIYDTLDFIDAIRKLAIKNRHVEIRILVAEPEKVVRNGHKLPTVAANLSSFIELRKPSNEYKNFNEAVIIADEIGYLYRENVERYNGKVNFNNRRESKFMLEVFDKMWETAKPDPNFRRMHI